MNEISEKFFSQTYFKLINMANLLTIDFIFCTHKLRCFTSSKHNTISVRIYRNYSKKFYEEQLTKMKFQIYLLFSFADSAYNHLSKILQDTINDIVAIHDIRIKGNTSRIIIELIRGRVEYSIVYTRFFL